MQMRWGGGQKVRTRWGGARVSKQGREGARMQVGGGDDAREAMRGKGRARETRSGAVRARRGAGMPGWPRGGQEVQLHTQREERAGHEGGKGPMKDIERGKRLGCKQRKGRQEEGRCKREQHRVTLSQRVACKRWVDPHIMLQSLSPSLLRFLPSSYAYDTASYSYRTLGLLTPLCLPLLHCFLMTVTFYVRLLTQR